MGPDGPKMGPGGFFPTNPDLPNILGRTDFEFENFYFFVFLDPKFPGLIFPKFPEIWSGPGLGRGPGLARLGPGLGPCENSKVQQAALGDTDFDFENLDFLDPRFPDFWISRFLDSHIQGCHLIFFGRGGSMDSEYWHIHVTNRTTKGR